MEEINFDGTILLQTRLMREIQRISELPFQSQPRLPNQEEIRTFLSFLSLKALASGFRYDDTVPDAEKFLQSADAIGLKSFVSALPPSIGETFIDDAIRSVSMARNFLEESLESFSGSSGPTPPEERKEFFKSLSHLASVPLERERIDHALEGFNEKIRGGKLLIGLSAEPHRDLLAKIQARASRVNEDDRSLLHSSLINNFRLFLLTEWAGRIGALFAGPPEAVEKLAIHKRILWLEFEKALLAHSGPQRQPNANPDLSFAESLPMLGLVILSEAPSNYRPQDLFGFADKCSERFGLKDLQKELLTLQVNASRPDALGALEKLANDRFRAVRRRGGPKHEELGPLWKSAATQIMPAIGREAAAATAKIVAGGNMKEAVWIAVAKTVTSALFALRSLAQHHDPAAAAISNLMALHQYDLIHVSKKVEEIWKPRKPV